jgi:hypothetical protein
MNYIKVFITIFSFSALVSCHKDKNYVINDGTMAEDIISISYISTTSTDADSSSSIRIRVSLQPKAQQANFVTLSTNKGKINGIGNLDSVQVNLNRYADFTLTSGQVEGAVFLRAAVLGSFFRDTIVNFKKAYPDTIIIKPASYVVQKNSPLTVDIELFKNLGFASKNQSFQFKATNALGNPEGQFSTNNSFEPGNPLVATFTPSLDFEGEVTLEVVVVKDDASRIKQSVKVKVL